MSSVQIPMTPGQTARSNSQDAEHRSRGFGRGRPIPPNPFEKLDSAALVSLYPLEPEWAERLKAPGLQIVGDSGRGKTTTLLQIRAHLGCALYHYSRGDLPTQEADWHLLDEAQRVEPQQLAAWVVNRRVVLATHRDLGLGLPGWSLEDPEPARIARLLNRRLEAWGAAERVCLEGARLVARSGSLERARAIAFLAWAETRTVTPEALAAAARELGA